MRGGRGRATTADSGKPTNIRETAGKTRHGPEIRRGCERVRGNRSANIRRSGDCAKAGSITFKGCKQLSENEEENGKKERNRKGSGVRFMKAPKMNARSGTALRLVRNVLGSKSRKKEVSEKLAAEARTVVLGSPTRGMGAVKGKKVERGQVRPRPKKRGRKKQNSAKPRNERKEANQSVKKVREKSSIRKSKKGERGGMGKLPALSMDE